MIRLVVSADDPDPQSISRAAAILSSGGVAAIPTDTLYGLAVDPFNAAAVERVFTIKSRALERALPLVAGDLSQVRRWIGALSPIGERLAAAFWPGPLTLVVTAPSTLPPDVTGGGTTVGIRVPAHRVTRALCLACDWPLTATSANVSGAPPTADPDAVAEALGIRLDVLVDAGRCAGGAPSTLVDVSGTDARLIRAGAIEWASVQAVVSRA